MNTKEIIQLIKKIKRQQRKDCTKSDLIKDKMFTTQQMANAFDKYLDYIIEELKKKKDETRIKEIESELRLKKIELDYLEEKAIEERKPNSMVNPDGLIEMVKSMIYNLEKELKEEKDDVHLSCKKNKEEKSVAWINFTKQPINEKMSKTRFTGKYTKSGKRIMELEVTQEDCDEMDKFKKELGLDRFPDYEESKPTKLEFLLG